MKNEFNFDESNSMLNDLSVEWIDKELLEYILKSLSNMSKRQFNRFIRDSNDWVSKIGKVNNVYPVKYPNIRQAADFLAIPPWLLFYRADKGDITGDLNKQIIRLFQKIPPNLPIYEVSWDTKKKFSFYNSKSTTEKVDKYIGENFGTEKLSEHSQLKGKWKDIQQYLINRMGKVSFSGSAMIFTEEYSRLKPLGTLRVKSDIHISQLASEVKKYGVDCYWSTAWFTVELHVDEVKFHKKYVDDISNTISIIMGTYPWKFTIKSDERIIQLYSWHSLRDYETEELEFEVSSVVENKLSKVKYPLQISFAKPKDNYLIKKYNNDDNLLDLNNLIKNCLKNDQKKSLYNRRVNTINYLFDCGYIKEEDILELRYNVTLNGSIGEEVLTARVSFLDNAVKLMWLKDNNYYSVTGLTKKIFNEFDIVPNLKSHNGNNYWGLVSDNQSLLDEIKSLLKN